MRGQLLAGLAAAFLLALPTRTWAQALPDSGMVRYTPGFTFHDGLYYDFAAFRANRPSVPKEQLTTTQGQAVSDLRSTNGKVQVPDSAGGKRTVALYDLWGFCDRGTVYIKAGNDFSRIGLMGSIGHLMFDATYRDMAPYGYHGGRTYTVEEQRFLDMESGAMVPVSAEGLYSIIQRDPVLKEEFEGIPRNKRKKEVLFLLMRRYNERNPLYIPR